MAVRVRLTRVGGKKNAIWRVVVADRRSPRDGRFIEMIGHYNPQTQPSQIVIDRERLQHWLDRGAEPTNTVRKLMRAEASAAAGAVAPDPAPGPEVAREDAPAEAEAAEAAAAESAADAAAEPSGEAAAEPVEDTAAEPSEDAAGAAEAEAGDGEAPTPEDEAESG